MSVSRSAVVALLLVCLFCIGHAYDPLPGNWRYFGRVSFGETPRIFGVVGDTGAIMRVDYDSATGTYAGYIETVSDSMVALDWSADNIMWWGITYHFQILSEAYTNYAGFATYHVRERRQTTPDITTYGIVAQDCSIQLKVVIQTADNQWPRSITRMDTNLVCRLSDHPYWDNYENNTIWGKVK